MVSSRNPGPKPKPINELLFWEREWYLVFREMRGRLPTYEIALGRRRYRELLRQRLEELKALPPVESIDDLSWWREFEIAQLEGDLRPRKPSSNPELWKAIVDAPTGSEIQRALKKYRWHWCGRTGYATLLYENAEQFVKSKNYPYYPKGKSSAADKRRLVYFARAMAGITCGLSPITGWDRLYKLKRKHGRTCSCIWCEERHWEHLEAHLLKPLTQIPKSDWGG